MNDNPAIITTQPSIGSTNTSLSPEYTANIEEIPEINDINFEDIASFLFQLNLNENPPQYKTPEEPPKYKNLPKSIKTNIHHAPVILQPKSPECSDSIRSIRMKHICCACKLLCIANCSLSLLSLACAPWIISSPGIECIFIPLNAAYLVLSSVNCAFSLENFNCSKNSENNETNTYCNEKISQYMTLDEFCQCFCNRCNSQHN
jgi:hypothetical protein